ncbi:Ldh family oxidoreductase [Tropicibacter naphthalenivorans]|uniref:(2R)-3-sulfolactate dehydrogenase (NADP(+)) n=1 Tax=Tropicibacter naphthalenivorans TaxID=441103 RepID=A0A0P1GX07_9RHOB|nr:Ldh family oxidoreductase [Tropicibacter naphthalenivorans]CUH81467.1 (2R)-3-sulfolactate dehydrogenase (NADP(+)) [Tropicibacter naphthalenivorans]SMD00286.1 (2R)-3-sulfolactate dehydrogenase (NADP+) [Tropicibacter naphthalenivorans]
MPIVSVLDIAQQSRAAMLAHGASPTVAREMSRAIAWAEARGNRICGLYYLESYCQQMKTGRVDGQAVPQVHHPRPAEIVVDARHGFAQPAFSAGLDAALQAAKDNGIARLGIINAHTCTALGYFTKRIALGGCIGVGFTNASPIVAPPGGKTRVIGTNPIAFAVPDGNGAVSMMFDQATTTVALGAVTMAKAAGEPIPEGWALDKDGAPTTDPDAALQGSLCSAGGYKGWGFGLMSEVLAACLLGGTLSKDVAPLKAPDGAPHDLAHSFVLIHPSDATFFDRMRTLAQAVAADEGCRMPGQDKLPKEAVEVPDALWALVQRLAG